MKKTLNITGFAVLSFFTFLLFILSFAAALNHGSSAAISLTALILAGLLYKSLDEFTNYFRLQLWNYVFQKGDFFDFVSVVGGAGVTFVLSVHFALGPVVAAGLVGILIALTKPRYSVPTYCGAFVGMASNEYLSTTPIILFAGIIAGLVYIISSPVFDGFGGKLGTIAFAGCIITGIIIGSPLQSQSLPGWETGAIIVAYSIPAAVLTFIISVPLQHGPVMGSGIIGLTGGLLLPVLHPEIGTTLGVMVICSSFAGMSSSTRFPRIHHMAIAGFFSGVIFIFSMPYLGGAGGKLGTIAFGSVIALRGLMDLSKSLKTKFVSVLSTA